MKRFILFGICCLFALQGVGQGTTVQTRIALPAGFSRINVKEGSFEEYLRNLPLRPRGSKVHYYDGREKRDTRVYCAVVDMEIGKRDLQQCADAVIRLRAVSSSTALRSFWLRVSRPGWRLANHFVALNISLFPGGPGRRFRLNPTSRRACFTMPFTQYVTRIPPVFRAL